MYKRVLRGLFLAFVMAVVLCQVTFGQRNGSNLLDRKLDIRLSKATMLEVCSTLAVKYNIPMGFERAPDYYDKLYPAISVDDGAIKLPEGKITISGGSVREILDSLVRQEGGYRWTVNSGVVNIFPTESRDEIIVKLLETRIEKFDTEKAVNNIDLRDKIFALEEVQKLLATNNITASRQFTSSGASGFRIMSRSIPITPA